MDSQEIQDEIERRIMLQRIEPTVPDQVLVDVRHSYGLNGRQLGWWLFIKS